MYYVNKIVWFFANPLTLALFALAVAAVFALRGHRRLAGWSTLGIVLWLWVWSSTAFTALIGLPLEAPYRATMKPESLPEADAIVALGGGMFYNRHFTYPDMAASADRVWHAARLWKAGKAPRVIVTGQEELKAAVPLLVDLGVPRDRILVDDRSRNTYENARFTEELLKKEGGGAGGRPAHVLLVTSAWHMTRARGNFAKTSLVVTPAATDFSASMACAQSCDDGFWPFLIPSGETFTHNVMLAKEWLGRLARR